MIRVWETLPRNAFEESFAFLTARNRWLCGRCLAKPVMPTIKYKKASSFDKKIYNEFEKTSYKDKDSTAISEESNWKHK